MDFVKLTNDALDINEISGLVFAETCGAVSIFAGVTRDNFDSKAVVRLEYEAYEPMAVKALKAICEKIRGKWPNVHNIAIYHRLGTVPVKESSVVIAISSPHRSDSLESVQYAIEKLKASVPIWKKEIYSGNNSDDGQWKENAECPWANKK